MKISLYFAACSFILTAFPSYGEFTYVDATLSNSTLNGQAFTLVTPANYDTASPSGGDGLWSVRQISDYEGGDFFESDSGRPPLAGGQNDYESLPDIITSITLPTAGTYRIVAVFAINNRRDVAAKIGASPGSGDVFTRDNSLDIDQTLPSPDIVFDSSYTNGRDDRAGGADLGTVTTTSDNESIQIYINGLASTTDLDADGRHDDERTRYDGIGYELIVPLAPAHRDVFIIAGQSNADGRGLNDDLTGNLAVFAAPQPDVLIYYSNPAYGNASDPLYRNWSTLRPGFSIAPPTGTGEPLPRGTFGVELGAATVLSQTFDNPAFIKVSQGATRLGLTSQDWHPPLPDPALVGPLYTELVSSVQDALQDLTDNGDTYTLHGVYWHQGEGDSNRLTTYSQLLQNFATSLRADLGKPNLRFIVGELAHERDPTGEFRAVQWDASRQLRNSSFLSAINLLTTDNTHFDAAANIESGLRLGELFVGQGDVIDFEPSAYGTGELDRQNDFESAAGIAVVTTSNSGEYLAGQAIEDTPASGSLTAFRENVLPLAQARALEADFLPSETNSALLVAGWQSDSNDDGLFDLDESGLGLGLGADGLFQLRVGSSVTPSTGFAYQADTWYRLTASWSAPDASGVSQISLFARDLTNAQDLNGGAAIATASTALTPANWLGTGIQLDRGMIDSIGVERPGFAGWLQNRYPTLEGGVQGDPDFDGIANAFEYALGLDPTSADPDGFDLIFDQVVGEVTLSLPEIARAEDTIITLETSTDLSLWFPTEAERGATSRDFIFPTTDTRRFFRQMIEICE